MTSNTWVAILPPLRMMSISDWGVLNEINKIWKSNLPDKMKRNFFRATVESILAP